MHVWVHFLLSVQISCHGQLNFQCLQLSSSQESLLDMPGRGQDPAGWPVDKSQQGVLDHQSEAGSICEEDSPPSEHPIYQPDHPAGWRWFLPRHRKAESCFCWRSGSLSVWFHCGLASDGTQYRRIDVWSVGGGHRHCHNHPVLETSEKINPYLDCGREPLLEIKNVWVLEVLFCCILCDRLSLHLHGKVTCLLWNICFIVWLYLRPQHVVRKLQL